MGGEREVGGWGWREREHTRPRGIGKKKVECQGGEHPDRKVGGQRGRGEKEENRT